MSRKRSLIDAARDPIIVSKTVGDGRLIDAARNPIIVSKTVGNGKLPENRGKPSTEKKPRNILLVSASILVGFIAGVLINRYFRLL